MLHGLGPASMPGIKLIPLLSEVLHIDIMLRMLARLGIVLGDQPTVILA